MRYTIITSKGTLWLRSPTQNRICNLNLVSNKSHSRLADREISVVIYSENYVFPHLFDKYVIRNRISAGSLLSLPRAHQDKNKNNWRLLDNSMISNKTFGLSVLFKWGSIAGVVFRETGIEGVKCLAINLGQHKLKGTFLRRANSAGSIKPLDNPKYRTIFKWASTNRPTSNSNLWLSTTHP